MFTLEPNNRRLNMYESTLIRAAQLYYEGRDTGLTDAEYDKLFADSGMTKAELLSHVHLDGEKMRHDLVIPSYPNKITDWSLLKPFMESKNNPVLTKKFDGCSIVAYYHTDGTLDKILTRSDEETGHLKTQMLKNKFPQKVDPRVMAILAEALVPMEKSDTRASANGLINSKTKQKEVDENLVVRVFDVITSEYMNYKNRIKLATDAGMIHGIIGFDQAEFIRSHGNDGTLYIDGVVVYYDGGARIFKLESATDSATVTINKEILCVSEDTGLISTKYGFDPVVLNNVRVKCVGNCGSIPTIKEKGIGIGTLAEVHLTKGVIPAFRSVIKKGTVVEDRVCPECGSPLEEFQGKLICNNHKCKIWSRRYLRFPDKIDFIKPPRFKSWDNLSDKQKEYANKLSIIYNSLSSNSEE